MPKGPRGEERPADANQLAKLITDIATGEAEDAPAKDEAAVALGRKGGQKRAANIHSRAASGDSPQGGGEAMGEIGRNG